MNDPVNWAIERMSRRVDLTIDQVRDGFPHFADTSDGRWETSPDGDWTGGHWIGMLWLALHHTGDERYRTAALRWVDQLQTRTDSETIFRGFLFWYGAAIGNVLTGNPTARHIAIAGARGLAEQYNPIARVIPLGEQAEEATNVGRGDTSIDGVQGCGLLMWAARETGEERLRDVGINHALRHIELCIREDGSVCQSARFDQEIGQVIARYTHKGFTDTSTWARAQAWAMLGYAVMAAWVPERPEFLSAAIRTADWWLGHVPEDLVTYWDFDAPRTEEATRDTSATAIAAASLLKIAALLDVSDDGTRYRDAARHTVEALTGSYLTPTSPLDDRPAGILTEGCYNHRLGLATKNELIWGSYYLYESLLVIGGRVGPLTV